MAVANHLVFMSPDRATSGCDDCGGGTLGGCLICGDGDDCLCNGEVIVTLCDSVPGTPGGLVAFGGDGTCIVDADCTAVTDCLTDNAIFCDLILACLTDNTAFCDIVLDCLSGGGIIITSCTDPLTEGFVPVAGATNCLDDSIIFANATQVSIGAYGADLQANYVLQTQTIDTVDNNDMAFLARKSLDITGGTITETRVAANLKERVKGTAAYNSVFSTLSELNIEGSGDILDAGGLLSIAYHTGSSDITDAYSALAGNLRVTGSNTVQIAQFSVCRLSPTIDNVNATIEESHGLHINTPFNAAVNVPTAGTVNLHAGIMIGDQNNASTPVDSTFAIYTDGGYHRFDGPTVTPRQSVSSAATITVSPTKSYVSVNCTNVGATVTISKTNALDGQHLWLRNIGTQAFTMTTDSNQHLFGSPITVTAPEMVELIFDLDADLWLEVAHA